MKVTHKTRYTAFVGVEKYLQRDAESALYESAQKRFGRYEDMTFAEFLRAADGEFDSLLDEQIGRRWVWRRKDWKADPSVLQVYWIKGFGEFAKSFAQTLDNLQVPQTAEEKTAGDGLPKMTFAEGMLVFIRSYFGLPSFEQAEKIKIAEIMIAKHDAYCNAMFQKKLNAIHLKNARAKK